MRDRAGRDAYRNGMYGLILIGTARGTPRSTMNNYLMQATFTPRVQTAKQGRSRFQHGTVIDEKRTMSFPTIGRLDGGDKALTAKVRRDRAPVRRRRRTDL